MSAGSRRLPPLATSRLSPALVEILARMIEAKLAAAGSPPASSPAPPAFLSTQMEGIVCRCAGDPAGRHGG